MSEEAHTESRSARRTVSAWLHLLALNVLLSLPAWIELFHASKKGSLDMVALMACVLSCLGLGLVHSLAEHPRKLHLLLSPFYLVVAMDLFVMWNFGGRLTTSYLVIMIGEWRHATDFLSLFGVQALCMGALVSGVYAIGLRGIGTLVLRRRLITPLALAVALVFVYGAATVRQGRALPRELWTAWSHVLSQDRGSPFGVLSQGWVSWVFHQDALERLEGRRDFEFGARPRPGRSSREVHILAIGESSRPDHWSLAGYRRPTNPLLGKRKNVVFYQDVVAEIALTRRSVPFILTRATLRDGRRSLEETSLVSVFKEAGFRTHWLSTQKWDISSEHLQDFSLEAHSQRFFDRRLDEVLLDALDDALAEADGQERVFAVVHMQGSHFRYERRYPSSFERFPLSAGSDREALVNAYDNTIVYTDFMLSSMIDRLENLGIVSSLLYISDHGENLLDDERQRRGHFINNEYDLPTAMAIWYSDQLAQEYPAEIAQLEAGWDKPWSTEHVFGTMLSLGGVEFPGSEDSPSIVAGPTPNDIRWVYQDEKIVNFDRYFATAAESASYAELRRKRVRRGRQRLAR
jgi:glucan phosphoethanolaminetransferase (alkaline phosphatase superfamily)